MRVAAAAIATNKAATIGRISKDCSMETDSKSAMAVTRRFIEALAARDGDALCSALHQDVVLESPYPMVPGEEQPGTRRCKGDSVRGHLANMPNVLCSLEFTNQRWRTADDGAVIFQGDGRATLPNGSRYDNHYLMIFTVQDGKIAHWYEYFNPVIAARANAMPLEMLP